MELKSFILYLTICFLLSFLIGVERQYRRRVIGLRTTILVSLGAFLYVCVSFMISGVGDSTRIAAQVVTGIGFLGAGVILKDGHKVRGLTTAATLWCDGAIGVLCACGKVKEAMVGTLIILFSNIVLRRINKFINDSVKEKNCEELYEVLIVTNKVSITKLKKDLNKFIEENNKLKLELDNMNITSVDNTTTMSFNILIPKIIVKKFIDLLETEYNKIEIKELKYNKVKEILIEEEESL